MWVECLAENLLGDVKQNDQTNNKYLAFYRSNAESRKIFGLNEFLFDIVIAHMIELNKAKDIERTIDESDKRLSAIQKIIWAVESEFQLKNSRSLLLDLNKLSIAKAKNKLFVMSKDPQSRINHWVENTLSELVKDDDANIYLVKIPHPEQWNNDNLTEIEVIQIS